MVDKFSMICKCGSMLHCVEILLDILPIYHIEGVPVVVTLVVFIFRKINPQ